MKKYSIYLTSVCIFLIGSNLLLAQSNMSFKLSTISYQISDAQPDLVKLKLDQEGKLAFDPGLIISYEAYASSNAALKISQGIILDKATHIAGLTQIMIKFKVAKSFKHALYIGIGPVAHYRKSWADMENYIDEPVYSTNGDLQYKITWLSGEIEYNYYLNKFTDLSFSFNHIQAESIGFEVGLKLWITKKPSGKKGCVSCPSFH